MFVENQNHSHGFITHTPQHLYRVFKKDGVGLDISARSVKIVDGWFVFYQTVEFRNDEGKEVKEQRPMLHLPEHDILFVQTVKSMENVWTNFIREYQLPEKYQNTQHNTHIDNINTQTIKHEINQPIIKHEIDLNIHIKQNNISVESIEPSHSQSNNNHLNKQINVHLKDNSNLNTLEVNQNELNSKTHSNQSNFIKDSDEVKDATKPSFGNQTQSESIPADLLDASEFVPSLDNLFDDNDATVNKNNDNIVEQSVLEDDLDFLNIEEVNIPDNNFEVFDDNSIPDNLDDLLDLDADLSEPNSSVKETTVDDDGSVPDLDDDDWEAAAALANSNDDFFVPELEEVKETKSGVNDKASQSDTNSLNTMEELEPIDDLDFAVSDTNKATVNPTEDLLDLNDVHEDVDPDKQELDDLMSSLAQQINGQNVNDEAKIAASREKLIEIANRDIANGGHSGEYENELEEHRFKVVRARLKDYLTSINTGNQRFSLNGFTKYVEATEQMLEITTDEIASIISLLILRGKVGYKAFRHPDVQNMLTQHKHDLERMWHIDNHTVKLLNNARLNYPDLRRADVNLIDITIWLLGQGYITINR